jgi:hypothetical protein
VTVNPTTSIGSQSTATQTQCITGTFTPITVTAFGTAPLTYQWYSNTVSSNSGGTSLGAPNGAQTSSYTPQATVAGTLYYYCVVHSGCGTDVTSAVSGAFIVNPTVLTPVFSLGATSARCQAAGTVIYTATATNATGISYALDATTSAFAGNSIVLGTGAVTYAAGWSGNSTITTTAIGCNGPTTATHIVTTYQPATANAGTPISVCSNAGGVNITTGATATNYTGIAWTSSGTGGFTNANSLTTSVYTPSGADITAGSVTITLTATGNSPCGTAVSNKTLTIRLDGSWLGGGSDWNTAGNWDCNAIPSLTSDVIVANGKTPYPILSGSPTGMSKNLTIGSSASVTVTGATAKLQIAGNINISGTGPIDASTGTIEMKGSSAQTIPANTFAGNNIKDLIISNAAGVTLGGTLNLTGILSATTGNLASGGYLKLVSTATQTALIDGTGSGDVTGNVTMQRYLSSGFGYKYFSSPFSDATVAQFSGYLSGTVSIPKFYSYNENHTTLAGADMSGWTSYPSGTLNPMEGYAANLGALTAPKTVNLNGTVNNGPYSATLYNHNRIYTKGFNLVGNPYPSPIDWTASSGWTKMNIDNAIYFFNASGASDEYSGTYNSWVGGVSTGGSTNIIPSMQGFFVHVTDGSFPITGTLGMANSVRTNDLNPTFKAATIDSRPILRFTASFDEKNSLNDPFVIYFDQQTTLNFDKEKDALKMMNTDLAVPNVYAISSDLRKLSIDGMPEPVDTTKIPLGINILKDGWVNFVTKDIQSLSYNLNLFLVDKEKNLTQNLRKNPSYRFYLQAGEYNQRFELLFLKTDGTIAPTLSDNLFVITQISGTVLVKVNLPDNEDGKLYVSNMLGQIMLEKEVTNLQSVDISTGINSGVYVVTMKAGIRTQSEKTLIRKK